jgi:hypothetical protein
MPEIRTVTTLKRKRDEISASIRMYEKKVAQARADLAHVHGGDPHIRRHRSVRFPPIATELLHYGK